MWPQRTGCARVTANHYRYSNSLRSVCCVCSIGGSVLVDCYLWTLYTMILGRLCTHRCRIMFPLKACTARNPVASSQTQLLNNRNIVKRPLKGL
ncbi:hypothetical protein BDV11DRAFT_46569 [Aspergillus similis]